MLYRLKHSHTNTQESTTKLFTKMENRYLKESYRIRWSNLFQFWSLKQIHLN